MIATLVNRNLKVYIRDKEAVFFSLLGVLIVVLLYIFFLGKSMEKNLGNIKYGAYLMNTYIMSGVICVSTLTTTLGAYGNVISDKVNKRNKDLIVSPFATWQISLGYVISAWIIGFVISILCLMGAEIYIVYRGGQLLQAKQLINMILVIAMGVTNSGCLSFFLVSLVNTHGAYSGLNVIVGTLAGFITGIYIPIGSLSQNLQNIVKLFPVSHSGVLIRKILMENAVNEAFFNVGQNQITSFSKSMGIDLYIGDNIISVRMHLIILAVSAVIFLILGVWNSKT